MFLSWDKYSLPSCGLCRIWFANLWFRKLHFVHMRLNCSIKMNPKSLRIAYLNCFLWNNNFRKQNRAEVYIIYFPSAVHFFHSLSLILPIACFLCRVPRDLNCLRVVECISGVNTRSKLLRSAVAYQILLVCFDNKVAYIPFTL